MKWHRKVFMFKIQNSTSGSLSLSLENSCIILPKGSYYDLDGICSREWINENSVLQILIQNKHIRVVQDSEAGLAKSPISKPNPGVTVFQQKQAPKFILYPNALIYSSVNKPNRPNLPVRNSVAIQSDSILTGSQPNNAPTIPIIDLALYEKELEDFEKNADSVQMVAQDNVIIDLSGYEKEVIAVEKSYEDLKQEKETQTPNIIELQPILPDTVSKIESTDSELSVKEPTPKKRSYKRRKRNA
jgi:hypothetical protein